jgi:hypothetical protein
LTVDACCRVYLCGGGLSLEDRQQDGDDDASYEDGGDQDSVADVFVGHVQASEGGDKQADRYEEEEDLQGQGVVGLRREGVGWLG